MICLDIFLIILIILTIVCNVVYLINELYYLQSECYNVKIYIVNCCKRLLLNIFFYLYIVFLVIVFVCFFKCELMFLKFAYCIELFLIVLLLLLNFRVHKLKITKRLSRVFCVTLFCCFVLELLLSFLGYVGYSLCVILLPLIILISTSLSIVILKPIEQIISKKFFLSTKNILHKYSNLIKIGITGSYGKTSTKEILNSILSTQYYSLATPKSYNTPFGITKTVINNLLPVHQVFICELGAKKLGEISELCQLIDVNYGIVTAVGRQHMNTFKSIENVYKTKKELPDYLIGKHCVFNLMNPFVANMYKKFVGNKVGVFVISKKIHSISNIRLFNKYKIFKACRCVCIFGTTVFFEKLKHGNVYAKNIFSNENGLKFDIYYGSKYVCKAETKLIGEHNVINILLAVAMAKLLNVKNNNIEYAISNLTKINARFEKINTKNNAIVINNGYNSNLDSAKYSFASLNKINRPNKVVITPGLIDCKNSYNFNYQFGQLLAEYATEVIIVKNVNKKAIFKGLLSRGFNSDKISFVKKFSYVQDFIDAANEEYVILIENDLPDNYK